MKGTARANCAHDARAAARTTLARTYNEALAAAKSDYASDARRCKRIKSSDRRGCLAAAREEYRMALGRAEEIRSAPLAMGPS